MKTKQIITALLLLIGAHVSLQAQSISDRQKADKSLDSLSNIKIEKVIYYQTPIEIYDDSLISNDFIPEWYTAFRICANIQSFKQNPEKVFKQLHSSFKLPESQLLNIMNNKNHNVSPMPYKYFYGEIWLTHLPSGFKIVLVFNKSNDKELPKLKFKLPVKKNEFNESIDTTRAIAYGIDYYISENGLLKIPDQVYVHKLITNDSEYYLNISLRGFKDMLYRIPTYKLSNRENRKRKFETMEKGSNGHVKKEVSDKP